MVKLLLAALLALAPAVAGAAPSPPEAASACDQALLRENAHFQLYREWALTLPDKNKQQLAWGEGALLPRLTTPYDVKLALWRNDLDYNEFETRHNALVAQRRKACRR